MLLVEPPEGTFTKQELERLAAYRAAVQAGFYSDWDGSSTSTDTEVLAWLPHGDGVHEGDAYPFTMEERHKLEELKAAVADAAGHYADDRPPAATGAPGAATPEDASR